jgi:ketosteroid isomerase-like protein
MTTQEIANDLVSMCKAGQFDEVYDKHYADDIVSKEAMPGEMAELKGLEAVKGKAQWWNSTYEVLGVDVEGPYVNGDQFAVRFNLKTKERETGKEEQMDEVAVYDVRDGKVRQETFFYGS